MTKVIAAHPPGTHPETTVLDVRVTAADVKDQIESHTFTWLPSGLAVVCEMRLRSGHHVYGRAVVQRECDNNPSVGEDAAHQKAYFEAFEVIIANKRYEHQREQERALLEREIASTKDNYPSTGLDVSIFHFPPEAVDVQAFVSKYAVGELGILVLTKGKWLPCANYVPKSNDVIRFYRPSSFDSHLAGIKGDISEAEALRRARIWATIKPGINTDPYTFIVRLLEAPDLDAKARLVPVSTLDIAPDFAPPKTKVGTTGIRRCAVLRDSSWDYVDFKDIKFGDIVRFWDVSSTGVKLSKCNGHYAYVVLSEVFTTPGTKVGEEYNLGVNCEPIGMDTADGLA